MKVLTHPKDPRPDPRLLKGRRKLKANIRRQMMAWTEKDEWRVQDPYQQDDPNHPSWAYREGRELEILLDREIVLHLDAA